jgi:hypothetical protein
MTSKRFLVSMTSTPRAALGAHSGERTADNTTCTAESAAHQSGFSPVQAFKRTPTEPQAPKSAFASKLFSHQQAT